MKICIFSQAAKMVRYNCKDSYSILHKVQDYCRIKKTCKSFPFPSFCLTWLGMLKVSELLKTEFVPSGRGGTH